jgi:predicted Zn-dependent protease
MQLLSVAVSHAMRGRAFRAVHAISDTSDLPASPVARLSTPGCAGPGPRVCLGSIGAAPDVSLDTLARYYSSLLGSAVGLLDPIAVTREVQGVPIVDAARSQLGAHALMNLLRETYPTLWQDPDVTVVVLTGNDLWFEDRPDLHYGFGTATSRQRGGGFAIVSTARMDPAAYGRATDAALLERRVRAMVGKYLAVLRYGEAPSSDPASPVYNAIQAPTDLDRMRAFQPPRQ